MKLNEPDYEVSQDRMRQIQQVFQTLGLADGSVAASLGHDVDGSRRVADLGMRVVVSSSSNPFGV